MKINSLSGLEPHCNDYSVFLSSYGNTRGAYYRAALINFSTPCVALNRGWRLFGGGPYAHIIAIKELHKLPPRGSLVASPTTVYCFQSANKVVSSPTCFKSHDGVSFKQLQNFISALRRYLHNWLWATTSFP